MCAVQKRKLIVVIPLVLVLAAALSKNAASITTRSSLTSSGIMSGRIANTKLVIVTIIGSARKNIMEDAKT
jgi:hypothetical protein